jgi:hypothetical protein
MGSSGMKTFAGATAAETPREQRSFIWTASVFAPLYFESYAPLAYRAPFTTSASASFWSAGSGDLAVGMGNDSGAFDLIAAGGLPYDDTTYSAEGVVFAAELETDWSDAMVDGCNDMSPCTCLLLSDEDPEGRSGYFALVAATADAMGDTSFNLAGTDPIGNGLPIVLQPIPFPTVSAVTLSQPDTLDITVDLPDRVVGVYEAESGAGCSCGPIGFSIYHQVVTPSSDWVPPDDRDPAAWTLAALAGGGPQGVTPLDQSVTVEVACPDPATQRVYLAAQLHFDSGFSTATVSGNSVPVDCVDGSIPLNPISQRHPASSGRGRKSGS